MIALIILGVVVGVLLLLLFLPFTVDLAYEQEMTLKIKCFGITLFNNQKNKKPKKSEKTQKIQKDSKPPKKENFVKQTYKEKGLPGTIKYFSYILTIVCKRLWWAVKHFKFRRFKFDLVVATDDAANTAIVYGAVCAALYPLFSFLQSLVNFKPKEISISADFDKTQFEFKTQILVKTQLFYLLVVTIGVIVQYFKLQRKEREKNERK